MDIDNIANCDLCNRNVWARELKTVSNPYNPKEGVKLCDPCTSHIQNLKSARYEETLTCVMCEEALQAREPEEGVPNGVTVKNGAAVCLSCIRLINSRIALWHRDCSKHPCLKLVESKE